VTDGWAGAGNEGEAWTLTAVERNTVYFAVNKTAEQTITVEGADAEKVSMTESGSVADAIIDDDGNAAALEATSTRTVFAVDTADLVFDGGTRSFTLKEGGRTIPVTLNVTPNLTGAAVFLVTHQDGEAEGSLGTLTRVDTGDTAFAYTSPGTLAEPAPFSGSSAFMDALAWVEYNANPNQEWLIRVEAAEMAIPRVVLSCDGYANTSVRTDPSHEAYNITIRLRGYGGTEDAPVEHIIKHNKANGNSVSNNLYGRSIGTANGGPTYAPGFINVVNGYMPDGFDNVPHLTLQIEKGITLQGTMTENASEGIGTGSGKVFHYKPMVYLIGKSVFVMKKGSKITGHYAYPNYTGDYSVIHIDRKNSTKTWYRENGYSVAIEAGAKITGNKIDPLKSGKSTVLIYFPAIKSGNKIQHIDHPVIFVSGDAIISDNAIGSSTDTSVDKVFFSAIYYSINAPTNADYILPLAADCVE
jgi:hypothetical protein